MTKAIDPIIRLKAYMERRAIIHAAAGNAEKAAACSRAAAAYEAEIIRRA